MFVLGDGFLLEGVGDLLLGVSCLEGQVGVGGPASVGEPVDQGGLVGVGSFVVSVSAWVQAVFGGFCLVRRGGAGVHVVCSWVVPVGCSSQVRPALSVWSWGSVA